MSEAVRVLIVEDKAADAELARREISKAIPDCIFRLVETRKDFLDALKVFQPDLILSDYNLPSFNGRKALELTLKYAPLTPLIIWTGLLSEDVAVECMKAGANNYIPKENIKLLGPAMIHALDEKRLRLERKQTEDDLIKSERRFRALIEHGRDNISLLGADGTLLWESPATDRTLGYSQDQFIGHNMFELVHPDDLDRVRDLYVKLVHEPGGLQQGSFRLQHASGAWRWVEATVTNLLDEPSVNAIVVNYRDITERKQAEIELQNAESKFRALVENSLQGISIYQNQKMVYANPALCKMNGYKAEELLAMSSDEIIAITHPEDRSAVLERSIKRANDESIPSDFEFRIIKKDGSTAWWHAFNTSIIYDSRPALLSTVLDVTDRKQAEEKLRESENRLFLALAGARMSVWEWDMETNNIYLPSEFFEMTGTKRDESRGTFESLTDFIHPEDIDRVRASAEKALANRDMFSEEFRILRPDGEIRWLSNLGHAEYDPTRKNLRLLGTIQDVTDRKKIEQSLQESEQRYHGLFENSPVAIWEEDFSEAKKYLDSLKEQGITDFQEYFTSHPDEVSRCAGLIRILDVNTTALFMYHAKSKEELIRSTYENLSQGEQEHNQGDFVAIAAGRTSHRWEGADETLTGESLEISLSWSIAPGHENDFSKAIVTTIDITERKRKEIELRLSEERFKQLADNIQEAFWITDAQSDKEIYLSPATETIWGRSIENLMNNPNLYMNFILPEDLPLVLSAIEKEKSGKVVDLEYRIIHPDGSVRWIRDRAFPIFDTDGNVTRIAGITADITERKEAENALRERDTLLRESQRIARVGHYQLNIQSGIWESSDVLNEILGIDKSYVTDINGWVQLVHPEQRDEMLAYFTNHVVKGRHGFDREYRILRNNDGRERWVHGLGQLEFDDAGNLIRMIGTVQDITESKQAEIALQESQARFGSAFEYAPIGMAMVSPDGQWLKVNHALCKLIGYTEKEILKKTFQDITHPDDMETDLNYVQQMLAGERESYQMEKRYFHKSGEIVWVLLTVSLVKDNQAIPQYFISQIQDITERKRNEKETSRHLAELEALYENGLAVSQLLTPKEIGDRIIKTFAEYLSWHHVAIRLKRNQSDLLDLIAFNKAGISETEKEEMEHRLASMVSTVGEGLSGWVVQTGKPFRTGDVLAHPQYVSTEKGIKSGLYMPLKVGDRAVGVISVESGQADAFSSNDERLLATLANQAAVAFENARLYQAIQQDLAERKRIETALRGSETHYRELADSITDIMFELDQSLHYTHWNKASEVLTGISTENAIGRSMREIFGESAEQTRIEKVFLDVLASRRSQTLETVLVINGEQRSFEINAYPSMRGVSVVAKDITERKKSEIIMQKRFALMEYAAHHSPADTAQKVADEVSNLTGSSIAFLQFMQTDQVTPGLQAWSTDALEFFAPTFSQEHHLPVGQAGMWADAIRQRSPVIHNDYESIPDKKGLPEGHARIIREMVFPIIRNERIVGAIGVGNKPQDYTQQDLEIAERFVDYAWDITERKQMEIELATERNQLAKRVEERTTDLIHANANLARALRVKDEFLANMSHELRTPLNAILGLSESLAEQIAGPLNDKQAKYINTISESGHHLLSLINDILDLAKIEAGQVMLDINTVNISSVCQASLRMVKQQAQKKNQELILEIDKNVDYMWADERRLKQMMVNLLSNAVKFTPDNGKIGLKVHGEQSENKVTVTVWDNGIGINQNDLSKLFSPFMQLDSGLARESTGTGLGLVLVAQMARLHGGSVTVESNPGAGSRFSIILPWEPALAAATAEKLRTTGKLPAVKLDPKNKQTILLIEDTQEVVMMMKDYLELAGYNIVTAQDGLEGIAQAKLTHPDLILMDVQMPRMNGLEATQKLRSEAEFKHTPIIALTALAMSSDRERCLAAGMDDYISKPINLKTLSKIIQHFLSNREEPTLPR